MPCDLSKAEYDDIRNSMYDLDTYADLSQLFKMLADPTRLKIFTILSQKEVCVEDITTLLDMTQSAISHQLASLRKTNLVKVRKVGKHAFYSLADEHVMQIFKQALDHIQE